MEDIFGVGPLIIRGADALVSELGIEQGSDEHVAIAATAGFVAGVVDPIGTAIRLIRDANRDS
jgi:hypothetical protein